MKRLLSAFFLGVLCSVAYPQQQDVTPTTALDAYLNNGDRTWAYEVLSSYPAGNTQAYSLLLVSQKWQGILWKHELIVFVPKKVAVDGALLFIGGSAVQDNMPKFAKPDDGTSQAMALIAEKNNAIAGILRQVPNQPLYGNLSEDALISYTLNEFRRNSDYSLPLLFPMVKSAIRAMDAIQEFAKETTRTDIKRFVVSGMSKRGWTTWLTGASQDPRVVAIVPMVIDMLNMPITLEYQKELYGGVYSEEIQDYVKLGIPQAVASDFGKSIVQMIDPYCYQAKLNMPKMLVMGTNDPYWTLDAVKHYIDDIPGQNFLSYVPNAEHGLGDRQQALNALNAFFGLTVAGKPYPRCEWILKEQRGKASLEIQASPEELVSAALWTADSPTRDFRSSKWTSSEIALKTKHLISTTVKYPKKDFSAFYVELVYKDANGGEYSVTTRPYIADTKHIFVK